MSYCICSTVIHTSKSCSPAEIWITTWPWIIWMNFYFWSIFEIINFLEYFCKLISEFFGKFFLESGRQKYFWGFGRPFFACVCFPVHLILFFSDVWTCSVALDSLEVTQKKLWELKRAFCCVLELQITYQGIIVFVFWPLSTHACIYLYGVMGWGTV